MTSEEIKSFILRMKEDVINERNPDAADKFFSATFTVRNPIPGRTPGLDGLKQALKEFFAAFPDVSETVEDIIVEGDKIAIRGTIRGTHRGNFMGVPPTSKPVRFTINEIYRFHDGKLQEGWVYLDLMSLMQQLEAIEIRTAP